MSVVFGIGLAIWFASVAAMFLSRALSSRRLLALRTSLAMCGLASVILAATSPEVSHDTGGRSWLVSIVFAVMAMLCGSALLMLRRSAKDRPVALPPLPIYSSEQH